MPTYELCKILIGKKKITKEKLDVFFVAGRLTDKQYKELIALL